MREKLIIFFLFFCSNIFFAQPQILDPSKIWEAEGLEKGEIPVTMDLVSEEEMILTMYLSPQKIWDDERTAKIQALLPLGKEGAYRIAALFFLKIAENPELKEKHENRMKSFLKYLIDKNEVLYDTRKKEYRTVGGFTITFADAKQYYEKALKNKLNEFEIKFADDKEKGNFKNIIYPYFLDPTEVNLNVIKNYMQNLFKTDLISFCSRILYLNEMSNKFTSRLIMQLQIK